MQYKFSDDAQLHSYDLRQLLLQSLCHFLRIVFPWVCVLFPYKDSVFLGISPLHRVQSIPTYMVLPQLEGQQKP